MKTSTVLNSIGLGLLLVAFAWSAQRAVRGSSARADDSRVVLRFAHWQLEGGLREAFDELARDYEKLHPGVRVEQVAVPERIFNQWLNTQLVGGTVTDLVAVASGKAATDEVLARHFTPLTEFVDQPNPYNRGTTLEGVPLRDTILDGLQGPNSYNANLLEYYGVSLSAFTVRMFYNQTLWRSILGDTPTPSDYSQFLEVCAKVRAHSEHTGLTVIPIAGSKDNAPTLIERLFTSQTQRMVQRFDSLHDLRITTTTASQSLALAYLRGEWTLDEPAIQSAFAISREAGLNFQPGYSQLARDDASFYFVQGRALMIATGSFDSTSFRKQAQFEIGVFDIPIPTRDHPRYGSFLLGPTSENEAAGLNFGIPRASKNFEQALDFLRYLSSQPVNAKFSQRSGWLPAVVGVEAPPAIAPFLPRETGYPRGVTLANFGTDTARVVSTANNLLVSPGGSVQAFREKIEPELASSIRSDLRRTYRNALVNVGRQDVALAGLARLGPEDADKLDQLLEAQNRREANQAWVALELARSGRASP